MVSTLCPSLSLTCFTLHSLDTREQQGEERPAVTSRPGHLEARYGKPSCPSPASRWELPVHRWGGLQYQTAVASPAEKWESGSVASSNSSHFDFSSNTG